MSYPQTPGFKVSGPSQESAFSERGRAATLRDRVAALIGAFAGSSHGYTADECARLLGASVLAIRPRLSELVKVGVIKDSGKRRENASGKKATVWCPATAPAWRQQDLIT